VPIQHQAAEQYIAGNRSDLAENETAEAQLLSEFMPPQLSEQQVDEILQRLFNEQVGTDDPAAPWDKARVGRTTGAVLKAFRASVDSATVDPDLVAARLKSIIDNKAASV